MRSKSEHSRTFANNTTWMVVGLGLRLALQAAYFVLIARSLGPRNYGAFIGIVALVGVLTPFSSWGSGNVLIKHVARDRDAFATYWGRALVTTTLSGLVLLAVVLGVARFVLPGGLSLGLVACVAAADLLFARYTDVSGQAFQAVEVLRRTAQFQVLPSLVKLVGALVLVALPAKPSANSWAIVYAIASLAGGVVGLRFVRRELGRAVFALPACDWEYREGFFFSVSLASQGVYNDIDKAMLARMSTLEAAGIYAAAYRIIDVALAPLRSLLFAAYARFFQHGAGGLRKAARFAGRLLIAGAGYGVVVAAGLIVAAPLLPKILGSRYHDAAPALRWLAFLPLMKAASYLAADALTGSDRQGVRSMVQAAVAAFNVAINLWLIPAYGWRGAVYSSLLSDGLLAVALWVVIGVSMNRRKAPDEGTPLSQEVFA